MAHKTIIVRIIRAIQEAIRVTVYVEEVLKQDCLPMDIWRDGVVL